MFSYTCEYDCTLVFSLKTRRWFENYIHGYVPMENLDLDKQMISSFIFQFLSVVWKKQVNLKRVISYFIYHFPLGILEQNASENVIF